MKLRNRYVAVQIEGPTYYNPKPGEATVIGLDTAYGPFDTEAEAWGPQHARRVK